MSVTNLKSVLVQEPMMTRIAAGVCGFLRRRWPYCAAAWVCAGWLYAEYAFRSGVRIPVGWPVVALVALLVVLPCAPVVFSIAVIACCVVCTVVPFAGADVNWLNAVPMWLALAVLGYRCGSSKALVVALVAGTVPSCFATVTGNELAASIAPTVQTCAIWWCIGSMVAVLGHAERDKAVAQERSEQYEHRLRILHILHDSLANDLVYALLQCRSITSRGIDGADATDATGGKADADESHANIGEIERTLERCLTRLRQDVITPERAALDEAGVVAVNSPDSTPVSGGERVSLHAALAPVLAETTRQLKSQGWNGVAHLNGECSDVDGETVRLVEACVRELESNIAKYGDPGTYALEVEACDDHVNIYSSNPVSGTGATSPALTSNCGLSLLQNRIEHVGGSMEYAREDGEWTICIAIPCNGHA